MGKDIAVVADDLVVPVIDGMANPADTDEAAGPREAGDTDRTGLVRRGQRGMVSAEWAVGIIAAIAIAGVLLAVVTSGPVKSALLKFILLVINSFSGIMR